MIGRLYICGIRPYFGKFVDVWGDPESSVSFNGSRRVTKNRLNEICEVERWLSIC